MGKGGGVCDDRKGLELGGPSPLYVTEAAQEKPKNSRLRHHAARRGLRIGQVSEEYCRAKGLSIALATQKPASLLLEEETAAQDETGNTSQPKTKQTSSKNNQQSSINGKAFEYALGSSLYEYFGKQLVFDENAAMAAAQTLFDEYDGDTKQLLLDGAQTVIIDLIEKEPRLQQPEQLQARIEPDTTGVEGDVRDITIYDQTGWNIGLSAKHCDVSTSQRNPSFAPTTDWGSSWLNIPCSAAYMQQRATWKDAPIFQHGYTTWRELEEKEGVQRADLFAPLVDDFRTEFLRLSSQYPRAGQQYLVYMLGNKDYYKATIRPNKQKIAMEIFNIQGTLGQDADGTSALTQLSVESALRDCDIEGKTDIIFTFEGGWQIRQRLKAAGSKLRPGLKFEAKITQFPEEFQQTILSY